jgi:hypothetical protein
MSDLPPLTDPDDDDLGIDPARMSDLERQLVEEFRPPVVDEDPEPVDASGGEDGETSPPDPAVADGEVQDEVPELDTPETPMDSATREVADQWDTLSDEDRTTASRLYEWYGTLDQDRIAAIDAATSGDYTLVRNDQITELQANYDLLQKMRAGDWETTPTEPVDDDDVPPQVRLQLEAQQREIDQLRTFQVRDQTDAQLHAATNEIEQAANQWRSQHPELTDDEFDDLQQRVVDSGQFAGIANRYGNVRAVDSLYTQALTQSPTYIQQTIDQRVQAELDRRLTPLQDAQARGSRASAVSGAASSVPDLSLMSADEAMIEELRQHMGR